MTNLDYEVGVELCIYIVILGIPGGSHSGDCFGFQDLYMFKSFIYNNEVLHRTQLSTYLL